MAHNFSPKTMQEILLKKRDRIDSATNRLKRSYNDIVQSKLEHEGKTKKYSFKKEQAGQKITSDASSVLCTEKISKFPQI